MAEFAFLFRSTRSLTPEELPVRNGAAREWALSHQSRGVVTHAFPLEDEAVLVRDLEVTRLHAELASVLIIEAHDLQAAVALAVGHPGLRFGSEIEVRPVKSVAPASGQK